MISEAGKARRADIRSAPGPEPFRAVNDVLLHIDSYPEPTPEAAIDQAIGFVAALGGTVSALAIAVNIQVNSNWLADAVIDLGGMADEQEAKSLSSCASSLIYFEARARAAGAFGQALLDSADLFAVGERVAHRANTRDLCIVPLAGPYDGKMEVVENAIFRSGRPVIVFRDGSASLTPVPPAKIVVAWDGSRCAARAMGDALPILKLAAEVRLLIVTHEKPGVRAGMEAEVVRHLATHGISAHVDEVNGSGKRIGDVLESYIEQTSPNLFVMGAYGHTRLREFILGGATGAMLRLAKAPLYLSH